MPRVAINGGMPVTAMILPLIAPASSPTPRPMATGIHTGKSVRLGNTAREKSEVCARLAAIIADNEDAYGLSKIKAEKLVQNWCDENGVVCTILRLPLLVGKNAPGNLGAMLKGIDRGYYFNIGGGEARKSMVLGQDVAHFIIDIAAIGGVYNLTDGLHPSFNELSSVISKNRNRNAPLNLSINFAKLIGKFGDFFGSQFPVNSIKINKMLSDLTFDDTKARAVSNWNPQSVIDYLKNNTI